IISADVADFATMKALFCELKNKYNRLNGIFHLAAIVDSSTYVLIKDLNTHQVNSQFLPKIYGAKILQFLMKELPVQFLCFFSSTASIAGGAGFASYAAANCYLNSLAEKNQCETATRWLSLNWDALSFSEQNKTLNE